MNIKKTILLGIMAVLSLGSLAQSTANSADAQYNEAQKLYDNGEFTKCEESALSFVNEKRNMVRTSTYKLLALCRLAQGDLLGAKTYVATLLKYDPYFTPSMGDPQRFIDIVNESKNQEAGITTASRQAESLGEVPVPVTLITEDMIHHSGCQNLQQLLCLYVPGMTETEGAETNIAMHGIYSLMQDKILIMIDGHRLNSSSTNAEAPDFRTSLDRVQQIEVLRGPASSLYGNCALTAVVNIITRKGAALNGGHINATVGTQGTYGASIVVGGGNNVLDIMGWGSIYATNGFASTVESGIKDESGNMISHTLYAHGYNRRPSYDIGMKGRWKDFTLSLNLQRSKMVPYINILQVPSDFWVKSGSVIMTDAKVGDPNTGSYKNYDYDKYQDINGNGPGVTRNNTRIDLDYKHSFDKFDIEASGYINFESTSMYNVLGDSIEQTTATLLLSQLVDFGDDESQEAKILGPIINKLIVGNHLQTNGAIQKLDWSGVTYGLQAQAAFPYKLLGDGSFVLGTQYELFSLSSTSFMLSESYSASAGIYTDAIFKDGSEYSISGFLQWKHKFPCRLILNAGLRYDHKERFSDTRLDKLSPRFSLIYKLNDNISFRGNYDYSFVDAPYIYRACILTLFGGGSDMKPETMHGFNLSANYNNKEKHLMAEIGAFYNILNDLCIINPRLGDDKGSQYLFVNAGKVRTLGIEGSAQYTLPRFFANFNATWQRVVTSNKYIVLQSQTYSTPAFHTNLTVAGAPYAGKGTGFFNGGKLWLRTTIQFQTATHYPQSDLMSTFLSNAFEVYSGLVCKVNDVKPQCVVGLGVCYDWKHIDIDLSLKNLFNNQYKIGSMLVDGVPHSGRQFLAKLSYKF